MSETCPGGGAYHKVIYTGLPVLLCDCPEHHADGLFSRLMDYLPDFNPHGFVFMHYEGSYLRALWRWLSHNYE